MSSMDANWPKAPASVVCHFKMAHFDRLAEFFGSNRFCIDDE